MLEMLEMTHVCRACGSRDRKELLRFDELPVAGGLLGANELGRPEPRFPLTVLFCQQCSLVQIRETVAPEALVDRAPPTPLPAAWADERRELAQGMAASRDLDGQNLVIGIGCGDGTMLAAFAERGVQVLAFEPAPARAAAVREKGVEVVESFFTRAVAAELGRKADIVLANHVLARVPDLPGFAAGVRSVLKDGGTAVIEVPYVRDLIENCEFDTLDHAHACYFSVQALRHLFRQVGLFVNDAERIATHGGSVRLFIETHGASMRSVESLAREERALVPLYYRLAARVANVQKDLVRMLQRLKGEGRRIAAYGAAARGATLLNATGVGTDLVDYVVDADEARHGKYLPGVHLAVHGPERLLTDPVDHVLLLSWDRAEEIMEQQAEFRRRGGRFIVPVPSPEIV